MKKEIVQDGIGSYLRIVGEQEDDIGDKVFTYQDIPGFLPLEMRRINGQKEYIYDISGKLSLKKYLDRGGFSLDDIRQLFQQVFDMADRVEEYLLDGRGVVVQEDFLYLNTVTGEWEGIYNKDNMDGIAKSVGSLLESVMEKMDQRDKDLVFFIYGMHKLTRNMDCTRHMLREYLTEDRDGNGKLPGPAQPGPTGPEPVGLAPDDRKTYPGDFQQTDLLPQDRQYPRRFPVIRGCLLPGMILTAGVAVPVVLWWIGIFRLPLSGGTDWAKAAGASIFFLVVAGYGAWKTMPSVSGRREGKGVLYHEERREENRVCLIPQMGKGDIVSISHFPYRIGGDDRGRDRRPYARILQEAGVVMIVDEESGQGTYHNDRRLVPWQKIPLEDGDLIRFGSTEYVVEITQPEYVI